MGRGWEGRGREGVNSRECVRARKECAAVGRVAVYFDILYMWERPLVRGWRGDQGAAVTAK